MWTLTMDIQHKFLQYAYCMPPNKWQEHVTEEFICVSVTLRSKHSYGGCKAKGKYYSCLYKQKIHWTEQPCEEDHLQQ